MHRAGTVTVALRRLVEAGSGRSDATKGVQDSGKHVQYTLDRTAAALYMRVTPTLRVF